MVWDQYPVKRPCRTARPRRGANFRSGSDHGEISVKHTTKQMRYLGIWPLALRELRYPPGLIPRPAEWTLQ